MLKKYLYRYCLVAACIGLLAGCKQGNRNVEESSSRITERVDLVPDMELVADPVLNDAARFVGGLPVRNPNSKLFALTQTKEWKNHAKNMNQIWNSYQQNLPKVLAFTQNELADINERCDFLYYPFGGPDFLFANVFFPDMDSYFLIGLEKAGTPIQVNHPSKATYRLYQEAVSDILNLSFFSTQGLETRLSNDTIDGVLPIISLIMARTDKEIISIENRILTEKGEITATNADGSPIIHNTGFVEIRYFRSGSRRLQTLYYLETDLSNTGLNGHKGLLALMKRFDIARTATFIKSASYLMHEESFSVIRKAVLDHSSVILQDDSSVPYPFFTRDKWNITLYGTFYKPVSAYSKYTQTELRDAYQLGEPKPLNFRVGFARQSNLLIARRKGL